MAATTLNLPLYQVLTELKVPEERARQAAEASIPDLSMIASRDDLMSAIEGLKERLDRTMESLEARLGQKIAERSDGQTKWIAGIAASTIIILLSSSAYLWPPTRFAAPTVTTTSQH